jgi:hypothetical protein
MTVIVMHRRGHLGLRRDLLPRSLLMTVSGLTLMYQAAGPWYERRERRHLEENPGGRKKPETPTDYDHWC